MPEPQSRRRRDALVLTLIAVFKMVKSLLLLILGLGLLRLFREEQHQALRGIIDQVRPDSHNHWINLLLERVFALPPSKVRTLSIGTFIYSALFGTESIGLFLQKTWAEWMVVITTGGLIPLEIYEVYQNPTLLRIAILVINIATMIYLLRQVMRSKR
jgi:uncharacterized membrane protein (DUF2068 family)